MRKLALVVGLASLCACATLGKLGAFIQAPKFEQAPGQNPSVRLLGLTAERPLGGAGVRLWMKVTNPNAFGFTLAVLRGTLFLDESEAATSEFPLGLPLAAGSSTVVPIELSLSFADLPGLRDVIGRALDRKPIAYHFDGTIGVETGSFGTPVFGPMTFVRGTLH